MANPLYIQILKNGLFTPMLRVEEFTDGDMVIPAHYAPKDPSEYTEPEKEKVSLDRLQPNKSGRKLRSYVKEQRSLALPDHLEQKISDIREGRDLSRITLEVLYGIFKTYELEMMQRKSLKAHHGHIVDGLSALIVNDREESEDDQDDQVSVVQVVEQKNKGPHKKPKKVKKGKAYLELQAKYGALLKKQSGKAYIADGKSWDDTNADDEDEEVRNYALMAFEHGEAFTSKSKVPTLTTIDLNASQYKETVEKMSVEMFHIHTSLVAVTEEVSRLTKANEKLESEKQNMDLLLVELESVKQENEYLKNKLKCANEIEVVLREKIEKNEVKLKSFRCASELVGQYHEKNKPCANITIGLDYDALNNKKKDIGGKGKIIENEDVPAMQKKVKSPMFKACEADFSEEELIIMQEITDEDNEKKNAETTHISKAEKKPMVNQDSKTPVKEMKNEDARKKKKNRNGKIGINKSNKFAYVAYAPRKQCQKCGSVNHLTHLCKKVVSKPVEGACKYNEANANDPYSFCDKFDCIPCNLKVMKSCHKLRVDLKKFEEKAGPFITFGDNNKDKGFKVLFNKEECTFISKKIGEVALKGASKGSLFVADLDSANDNGICCFYTKASVEQSKLWHKKLSHLNFKAINTLFKKELVRDMLNLAPLQLIYMDLFGPVNVQSISRKRYALVMVDDYSRNATEFCKGIIQEFSAARTPQQNGIVEKKNIILVEAARTMLQDAKMPTSFWEEAVNTACYTQNRYLINKNLGKSPYSILSKRKPTVKHLHVFGSKFYVLKDNSEYVGKFDSKVFEAIFLGYSLKRTAYKVYVIEQKKIMESTYVTFDDDKCPGLECLDDNEAEALKFENFNIDSDSNDEVEVNTNHRINEESTEQVNHKSGSSSHGPKFDSTNLGGEKEENYGRHVSNEEDAENTSQQTHIRKWDRSHTREAIISDPTAGLRTRSTIVNECLHAYFLSQVEPKKTEKALFDPDWISAMQEELNQFERNKVWKLVPAPKNRSIIGTKWVFRNKMDENGIVTRNKARLVAKGYSQEE
ncbi:hypothetical protein AgCh_008205 [Apium graveolens]